MYFLIAFLVCILCPVLVVAEPICRNIVDTKLNYLLLKAKDDECIPVEIWLDDIDHTSITLQAEKRTGIAKSELDVNKPLALPITKQKSTYIDKENIRIAREVEREKTDRFIIEKRTLSKSSYKDKISSFINAAGLSKYVTWTSTYSPSFLANLNKKQISALQKNSLVCSISYYKPQEYTPESNVSLGTARGNYTRDTLGYTGSGVKIGMYDSGSVSASLNPELSGRRIINLVSSAASEHASKVASFIVGKNWGYAPDATLYCMGGPGLMMRSSVETFLDQGVSVINMSMGGGECTTYDSDSNWLDHVSYQHQVSVVKSAGNDGNDRYITSPGAAYNIITVGAIDCNHTIAVHDDTPYFRNNLLYPASCKPEVFAPGHNYDTGASVGGTSDAAPQVTGLIAQLIEQRPAIASNPMLIKALVLVGGHDINAYESFQTAGYSSIAPYHAGAIDAKVSCSSSSGGKYFTGQVTTVYSKEIAVSSSWSYLHLALTWDVGSWIVTDDHEGGAMIPSSLIDLGFRIYAPGSDTPVAVGQTAQNSYELMEVPVNGRGGTWRVEVSNYSNNIPSFFAVAYY